MCILTDSLQSVEEAHPGTRDVGTEKISPARYLTTEEFVIVALIVVDCIFK
jgi:hypothetical protein